jgi:ABC-type sugar transport system substrate-binding protein
MRKRRNLAAALAAALALTLAACGDSDDSGGTESASSAAKEAKAPKPPTSPPETIQIKQPFEKPAAEGKTLYWLQCELPICGKIGKGVKEATAAIGWNLKSTVFGGEDPGSGLQTALQANPDAIAITGIPSAAVKPQLDAAAEAGIPVVGNGAPEQPTPTTYAAMGGTTTGPDGEDLAKWAINDSGGKAHIVSVTIPSFPSLKTTTDGTEKAVKQYCDECTTDVLGVTIDDLGGGQVASKIVAYIQSHPDVNYVLFTFADLAQGVEQALTGAGFEDKVKLIGNGGGSAEFQAIIKGGMHKAWQAYPAVLSGWNMVDAAARMVTFGELPQGYQQQIDHLPTYIVDTPEAARDLERTKFDWEGPAGYQDQFKKLWKTSN